MKLLIGDKVLNPDSGIRGTVLGYYFPDNREVEVFVKSSNGRLYRGPRSSWRLIRKCTTGYSPKTYITDENILN